MENSRKLVRIWSSGHVTFSTFAMAKHCRNGSSVEKPLESYSWFARQLAFHWTVRLLNNGKSFTYHVFPVQPMDVLPLTDVPRPMYEPWKTSIPSPASLQQWPAARWQFPFSLDEGNIPCKLPCVSWENHGKPMVPNGSLWFPMVPLQPIHDWEWQRPEGCYKDRDDDDGTTDYTATLTWQWEMLFWQKDTQRNHEDVDAQTRRHTQSYTYLLT